jgi:hypothetical protein
VTVIGRKRESAAVWDRIVDHLVERAFRSFRLAKDGEPPGRMGTKGPGGTRLFESKPRGIGVEQGRIGVWQSCTQATIAYVRIFPLER